MLDNGITPDQAILDAMRYGTGFQHLDFETSPPPPPRNPEPKKAPTVSEQLPKEQLLLKLLKMTTSSNDAEALVAIRKVNELLTSSGWDWDKFVAGKIRIVENPFKNLGTPPRREGVSGGFAPPPPPPPPRTAPLQGRNVRSLGVNKFADHCYCCGIEVMALAGGFFKPVDYNLNARPANPRSQFAVVCASCDGLKTIWDQPAAPIRKRGKTSINDLA